MGKNVKYAMPVITIGRIHDVSCSEERSAYILTEILYLVSPPCQLFFFFSTTYLILQRCIMSVIFVSRDNISLRSKHISCTVNVLQIYGFTIMRFVLSQDNNAQYDIQLLVWKKKKKKIIVIENVINLYASTEMTNRYDLPVLFYRPLSGTLYIMITRYCAYTPPIIVMSSLGGGGVRCVSRTHTREHV